MCGIVGYVGPDQALPVVLEGLRRLEYRGYDSAGVAMIDGGLSVVKRAGKLSELDAALEVIGPVRGLHRDRPHAVGDPRRADGPERASPHGLSPPDRGDPQRDHRELHRPALGAREARPRAGLRDRHRGRRPPDRGAGGIARRPRACHGPRARGRVRARRPRARRTRRHRRRPGLLAADRRARRRREHPRVGHPRGAPEDADRPADRREPDRRGAGRRRSRHRSRRAPSSSSSPSRWSGTSRAPRRAGSTTSC